MASAPNFDVVISGNKGRVGIAATKNNHPLSCGLCGARGKYVLYMPMVNNDKLLICPLCFNEKFQVFPRFNPISEPVEEQKEEEEWHLNTPYAHSPSSPFAD
jgi:hypothetical protein